MHFKGWGGGGGGGGVAHLCNHGGEVLALIIE